jgi:hypothetical protein
VKDLDDSETPSNARFMFVKQIAQEIDNYSKRQVQMAIYVAIELIDARNPEFTVVVSKAAKWMGVNRSTAYRVLKELIDKGDLVRLEAQRYTWGRVSPCTRLKSLTQGETLNTCKLPEVRGSLPSKKESAPLTNAELDEMALAIDARNESQKGNRHDETEIV